MPYHSNSTCINFMCPLEQLECIKLEHLAECKLSAKIVSHVLTSDETCLSPANHKWHQNAFKIPFWLPDFWCGQCNAMPVNLSLYMPFYQSDYLLLPPRNVFKKLCRHATSQPQLSFVEIFEWQILKCCWSILRNGAWYVFVYIPLFPTIKR